MVSTETPSENCAPQIYLRFRSVIKSPIVVLNVLCWDSLLAKTRYISVANTGGLQWFQLKHPLKIARTPNLLTSHHVGDKIATSYI